MTTLAIIGGGIVGRSLLYTLAKEQLQFKKIILLHSDSFTHPCSLSSTAIVAPRGVTKGHSPLGDLLLDGFQEFSKHFFMDSPQGIEKIPQYTGATEDLEVFKKRYPYGKPMKEFFHHEIFLARDEAFMIDPQIYLKWLLEQSKLKLQDHLEIIEDLVISFDNTERPQVKTQNGRDLSFDKVVFTSGVYNRFWEELVPDTVLKTSKPIQGSYLEFRNVDLHRPSFSLTLDGDSLVWNRPLERLLIGSTTSEEIHLLPDMGQLRAIHSRLSKKLDLVIPDFVHGIPKIGLREKARKRMPFMIKEGSLFFLGGFYKNGFTLSLKMSKGLSHQLL